MQAFESIVGMLLEREGYWVRNNLKVELTKDDKRAIGKPSCPRWDLDIVAYRGSDNRLLVVECKSYLDSSGVARGGFDGTDPAHASRYKLFNSQTLREKVLGRLKEQLVGRGACAQGVGVTLALATGKIASEKDRDWLHDHFSKQGWELRDDRWVRDGLAKAALAGHEDDVAIFVAKLMGRGA